MGSPYKRSGSGERNIVSTENRKNRFESGERLKRPKRSESNSIIDRSPPYDLTSEKAVLGCILLNSDTLNDLTLILRPDDFYDDAHRILFQAMANLYDSGKRVDVALLVNLLKTSNQFELVGGAPYLADLANCVPNAAHAIYYGEIVQSKAVVRRLIDASTSILQEAYDESVESKELLARAEQQIFQIQDDRSGNQAQKVGSILTESLQRIDSRMQGKQLASGVMTHFADFDTMTGGLHNGELIILAARPSMGKTAFAMNIAEQVAMKEKAPTLFVSLEMNSIELVDRLLCSVAKVNGSRMRVGTITHEEQQRLIKHAADIALSPLYIDDAPSRTVSEIAAVARRVSKQEQQKQNRRLGLIVIDYLQLIEPDNSKDQRQEQVAKIARRLKMLAREQNVPVLCLSQLNRQAEDSKDHRPKLSHLRESGAIEQDADLVMFLYRPEYHDITANEFGESNKGETFLRIAKHRNGSLENLKFKAQLHIQKFIEEIGRAHV